MKKVHIDLSKHKKEVIIGCIFLIAIISCIVFLFVNNDNNGDNGENNEENSVNNVIGDVDSTNVTEKDIIDVYDFSKEDAKELVSSAFNSDNFEYTVIVGDDGKYIVKVKNTINDNTYKFEVDPATKKYVEIQ